MELALIITVAAVFCLLGFVCVFSVAISMPGTWIIIVMALIIELCDGIYISTRSEQTFGWWLLAACVGLAVIGEILEFVAGALGAKHAGSTRRGMWGAIIGGVIGAVLGIGIPVPIVGSLIGAVIGTFIGAVVGETSGGEASTVRASLKPATGATIGRVLGTIAKLPIAVAVWIALSIAAFWP